MLRDQFAPQLRCAARLYSVGVVGNCNPEKVSLDKQVFEQVLRDVRARLTWVILLDREAERLSCWLAIASIAGKIESRRRR